MPHRILKCNFGQLLPIGKFVWFCFARLYPLPFRRVPPLIYLRFGSQVKILMTLLLSCRRLPCSRVTPRLQQFIPTERQ
jgi:hypothetical protein